MIIRENKNRSHGFFLFLLLYHTRQENGQFIDVKKPLRYNSPMTKESRHMPEKPPHYEAYSAYEAADIIIRTEEKRLPRPDMHAFREIAGEEDIRKKEERLQKTLERIRQDEERLDPILRKRSFEQKKISDAFEVTIIAHGEESEWLGSNVFITRTTEYDDVLNGVDAVAEFNAPHEGAEHPRLALAIDATTDQHYTTIEKKIKQNVEKILSLKGRTAEVEYFESQITEERGHLTHTVPIVLGLEYRHAKEILTDYANLIAFRELGRDAHKDDIHAIRERFARHPAQRVFLKEATAQLELYQHILKEKNDPVSVSYKEKISDLQRIIHDIEKEKEEISLEDLEDDAVLETIIQASPHIQKDYS